MTEYRIQYRGTQYWIPRQDVLVGRSRACAIVIKSKQASRHHARFRRSEAGLLLRDLGSKNGTYVNSSRVKEDVALFAGDVVRIGGEELEITVAEETAGDTYRMRPMWGPDEDDDETYTRERAATLDMVEVLMETRDDQRLKDRTSRCVVTTMDELIDQAGYGSPRLSPGDVERFRALADRLVTLCPRGPIKTWRQSLEKRLERAQERD